MLDVRWVYILLTLAEFIARSKNVHPDAFGITMVKIEAEECSTEDVVLVRPEVGQSLDFFRRVEVYRDSGARLVEPVLQGKDQLRAQQPLETFKWLNEAIVKARSEHMRTKARTDGKLST